MERNTLLQNWNRESLSDGLGKTTQYAYKQEVVRFLEFYEDPLENIDVHTINDYLIYMAEEGGIEISARKRTYSVMRRLLNHLLDHKVIAFTFNDTNPDKIRKVKGKSDIIPPNITESELGIIVKTLRQNPDIYTLRNITLVCFMFYTGLRPFEAIRCQRDWINRDELSVYVHKGKGKKDRATIINQDTIDLIDKYMGDRTGIIFMNKNGEPFTSSKPINDTIDKVKSLNPAINPDITTYSLRRGFCCYAYILSDYDIECVRGYMGHEQVTTTQRYLQQLIKRNLYQEQQKVKLHE